MTSPSVVRAAVPDDHGEIWRLFRALHRENGLLPLSERKVEYHIDRFLRPNEIAPDDLGPRGMIGVIGPVGSLEGAIVLTFSSMWYTDVITVDELLNYVDPQHRASNHAKSLISYAKHIVDNVRVSHPDLMLIIGILSTKRTAAKIRLYQRQLTPIGCFFAHPAPHDVAPLGNLYRAAANG